MARQTAAQHEELSFPEYHEKLLESCRKQLIEEKKMFQDEDGHFVLTDKGIRIVQMELERYSLRPAMALMIEQYILQKHDIFVD